MTLVLDSSVAIAWAIPDERDAASERLLGQAAQEGVVVPTLWHIEVANVLLKVRRRKRLPPNRVQEALAAFDAIRIEIDSQTSTSAWSTTLDLAERHQLSVYDATYLELALRRNLPLATRDNQLRQAAQACSVSTLG